ncbi:MAG: hypothetical protein RL110_47 [Bacteroidota bacterium]|jgi:hypothetical protein
MHYIEPFFRWRGEYIASEDPKSPFYEREYSEFEFEHRIYNFLIHPQWDEFGSTTLYLKILFVDYDAGSCILELIGEWNDAIENDIMTLKSNVINPLVEEGITQFVLILENVLNFHFSDDCYYEEWFDDIEHGWIAAVNVHPHVAKEMQRIHVDSYIAMGGELDDLEWRTFKPHHLLQKVENLVTHRLN